MKPGRTRLVLFGLVGVLMLAASWITFAYTEPPPPRRVTLATGLAGGAYVGFGEELAELIHAAKGPRVHAFRGAPGSSRVGACRRRAPRRGGARAR